MNNDLFTIVFFGKTGTGKSSTLNSLFKTNFETDVSVSCTKEPQTEIIHCENAKNYYVRIVDMPGIGEDLIKDEEYLTYYQSWLPKANVVVWLL